jgi:hypothetical protein
MDRWRQVGSWPEKVSVNSSATSAARPTAWRLRRALRYTLLCLAPVLSLLLALGGCGASPLPVTHRPAADLHLQIHISNQYSDRANVYLQVRVFDGTNSNGVALADKASLTCNGADIKSRTPATVAASGSCSRQAPGGAYKIMYTDEHGTATTATVPVPLGTFAILSPLAGSTVAIPTNGAFTARVSLPTPPSNGAFTIDGVSATCGAYPNSCGGVYALSQISVTPTATAGADATPTVKHAGDGGVAQLVSDHVFSATPTPPATPTAGQNPTPAATSTPPATLTPAQGPPPATATMTQDGTTGTITLRGDYSAFAPNTGEFSTQVKAQVIPDPGDFGAAIADYGSDRISSAITWAR